MEPGKAYRASELLSEAAQHGHAERTIRKAVVERLKIIPFQVRKDGKVSGWIWKIPAD